MEDSNKSILSFDLADMAQAEPILEMMASFYAIDNYPFDEHLSRQNLTLLIETPSLGRIWLIKMGEEIVGYIVLAFGFSFEYKGKNAFIEELFISNKHRNKGIGSSALQFVIDQARILGVKTLHLEAEKHNDVANAMYRKVGFVDNNRFLLNKSL